MSRLLGTPIERNITDSIRGALEVAGYRIVRVRYNDGEHATLQIMIDHINAASGEITVDDCEKANYIISPILDIDDPITDAYHLEVSSPGLDRPLVSKEDFIDERFIGQNVKIALEFPHPEFPDRKRFSGILEGMDQNDVCMTIVEAIKGGKEYIDVALPYDDIVTAQLMVSDTLLAPTKNAAKKPKKKPKKRKQKTSLLNKEVK